MIAMNEWISPNSLQSRMRPEVARRRITSFSRRFGQAHFYLAQHAAFPLALTPDLLYRLWANFSQTLSGERLNIPWVAVSDLLLSGLCEEVGQELYEMDIVVRNELLDDLQINFGNQRIKELADFILVYVRQQLGSPDPYVRNFAKSQQWTALAYIHPSDAARELNLALRLSLQRNDRAEQVRIISLMETFAKPLAEFNPLLFYAKDTVDTVQSETEKIVDHLIGTFSKKEVDQDERIGLPESKQVEKRNEEVEFQTQNIPDDSMGTSPQEPQSESPSPKRIFTAHDLRYHLEQHYASLSEYLQQRAKRYLGPLAYDAFEVDQVVGHVIEQLTHLHILGGGGDVPETALDRLSNAQFYAFLNRAVKNKAIDRLRKYRLQTNIIVELDANIDANVGDQEALEPLHELVASLWGTIPFSIPEESVLELSSQLELRQLLLHCIRALSPFPYQLKAILQELEELGAMDLLQNLNEEFRGIVADLPPVHLSQHRDHAHKKLRYCLQQNSTNLAVQLALRLSEYEAYPTGAKAVTVDIKTLMQDNLSAKEVQAGLKHLATQGLLDWHGGETLRLLPLQRKRLARFYEEGE
jgi:hypothetical protein